MHGNGHLRRCRMCGQSWPATRDVLASRELRGPRNITSSNIDRIFTDAATPASTLNRIFDDNGARFLVIEEKQRDEDMPHGQTLLLHALSRRLPVTVWLVRGSPERLRICGMTAGRTWAELAEGDFAVYQQMVDAWFARSRPECRTSRAAL